MTQENEMPPEIWATPKESGSFYAFDEKHSMRGDASYIRRAVTKEEAGEALEWLDGVIDRDFVEWALAHESLIRKLLEAHK